MKKFILFAVLGMAAFMSCTEKEYYDMETINKYYTVEWKDWQKATDQDGYFLYYYCTFREPLLTNQVLDFHSFLSAYLYYKIDNRDTFSPLPYSDFIVDDKGYKWEEQLSIEYQPGYITFILKVDDLYPVDPLSYYDFMVSIPKI
ncbi:hypothetical protein AGMMS50262_16710 [Bacteroidia bacterium]|nr:hypothetical protein AGMMS50262_16710 [Bacteroidia bacterium]